jgi:predicted Zn-ribbon and HTH transcriptional regulator
MEKKAHTCDIYDEVLDGLWNEAAVKVTESAQPGVQPPGARECDWAIRTGDWKHQQRCPDCLENVAENILIDAESHRADGDEKAALALEVEAAELQSRATKIRRRT